MVDQSLQGEVGAPGAKGLRPGVLGFLTSIVIGVASTAPAYSLAVSLGLVAAVVGVLSPAIMLVAFLPMLGVASAFYYLNRADPDCGQSFAWVTRAIGPRTGWMVGWAIIVADIVVMASLAEVAAIYTLRLVGIDDPSATFGTMSFFGTDLDLGQVVIVTLGLIFIAVLTYICWVGIELSARTQQILLTAELIALAIFSAVALWRVYTETGIEGAVQPSLEWLNPFAVPSASALSAAVIVALFIYWGWDTAASVNEESKNPTENPGRAAVVSTIILVATYVVVSFAATAFHGADYLAAKGEEDVLGAMAADVLGKPLDLIVVLAILSSAAASTQTTILPTARTVLSMGAKGAIPKYWAGVHSRFQTPTAATLWMGTLSAVWYVSMKIVSENLFWDAIAALGLMIAFFYGLTGYACPLYFRHYVFRSFRNFMLMGVLPLVGGISLTWAFVQSSIDLSNPANSVSGDSWFGFGPPFVITVVFAVLGVALMILCELRYPEFFHRKHQVAPPPAPDVSATLRHAPIG